MDLEEKYNKLSVQLENIRILLDGFKSDAESQLNGVIEACNELDSEKEHVKALLSRPSSKIKLNIGGFLFETTTQTLSNVPDTMLAAMFSGKVKLDDDEDGYVFVDRDGTHFRYILNFLRDQDCDIPQDDQIRRELLREAKFFRLEPLVEKLEERLRNLTWKNGEKSISIHSRGNWTTEFGPELTSKKVNKFAIRVDYLEEELGFNTWKLMIGVSLKNHPPNYCLGNGTAWAYIATTGHKEHEGVRGVEYGSPYSQGDIIEASVDLIEGTIGFSLNGKFQGIAYKDVPTNQILRIAVSASAKATLTFV